MRNGLVAGFDHVTTPSDTAQTDPAAAPRWTNLTLFLSGLVLLGVAGSLLDVTFNNYLNDVHHLDADSRGILEFPRELPGFLTVFLIAGLAFLAETRIAALAGAALGLGLLGLAWCGSTWGYMMAGLLLLSTGQHLMLPVQSSIAMDLATGAATRGQRLGQVNSYTAAARVVGYGLVWGLLAWVWPRSPSPSFSRPLKKGISPKRQTALPPSKGRKRPTSWVLLTENTSHQTSFQTRARLPTLSTSLAQG